MQQESADTPSTKPSRRRKRTAKKTEKGLGDTVENLIPEPVKKAVKAVAGDDCGCDKRKEWLNRKFPYFKTMDDKDKKVWETVLLPAKEKGHVQSDEQGVLIDLYQKVYGVRKKKSRCGSCVMERLEQLQQAYEASCES